LDFQRWLNSYTSTYCSQTIDVNDGSAWHNVYTNPSSSAVTDASWQHMTYDISAYADKKAAVQIRWGYRVIVGVIPCSGWNLDDIALTGVYTGPVVNSATPSAATIADAQAGTGTFTLAVTYNMATQTSVAPTIAFTPDVSSTLNAYNAINNGTGTWTLPDNAISPPLADGRYDVTVTGTDPAGNVGTDSTTGELLVDTQPPTSHLNPLAAQQTGWAFPLSMTGSDPVPGTGVEISGVASYAVYVSVENGPFTLWQTIPASTPHVMFVGPMSTHYAVYSLAIDRAGNVESKTPVAEATTYIPNLTPPNAADDANSSSENGALSVAAPGVLANDIDEAGNSLTASLVAGPAHGAVNSGRATARPPARSSPWTSTRARRIPRLPTSFLPATRCSSPPPTARRGPSPGPTVWTRP
jgi:hypothetical protein